MPHDLTGTEIHQGDLVWVPCTVKEVHQTPNHCNVTLETVEPMFPDQHKSTIVLNSKQVAIQGEPVEMAAK